MRYFLILCLLASSQCRNVRRDVPNGQYSSAILKDMLPRLAADRLQMICEIVRDMQKCINESDEVSEADMRSKSLKIIPSVLDIACDEEITSKFSCFTNVTNGESAVCQSRCGPYTTPMLNQLAKFYPENGTFGREHADQMCQFVHCRLVCHKQDLIAQCQESGYQAIKRMVHLLARLIQVIGDTMRPQYEFLLTAKECKPEKVIDGA